MISQIKSNKKTTPSHYFNARKKIELYQLMRKDPIAYAKLRHLPYKEAINRYAEMVCEPSQLSFGENINRINDDINHCNAQLRSIELNSYGNLSNSEKGQVKKAWVNQKQKLTAEKLKFAVLSAQALERSTTTKY